MRQCLAVLCTFFWITSLSYSQPQESQSSRSAAVHFVEITKIDAKKKSLQVKDVLQPPAGASPRQGQGSGRQGGGGGGGGRQRGGGGGRGGRGGGVGFPGGGSTGGGSRTTANQAKVYKVFVTKDTEMKLYGTKIDFTDLRVGDRITVEGNPKGKNDLFAMTITREN